MSNQPFARDPYGHHPGPMGGRPRWLMPVAVLALVLAVAVASAVGILGYRYVHQRHIGTDPGVAICEQWRAEESVPLSRRPPSDDTPQEYQQVREQFERSRHADLHRTGVRVADLVTQTLNARGTPRFEIIRDLMLAAYLDLQGACAEHGVVIVINRN